MIHQLHIETMPGLNAKLNMCYWSQSSNLHGLQIEYSCSWIKSGANFLRNDEYIFSKYKKIHRRFSVWDKESWCNSWPRLLRICNRHFGKLPWEEKFNVYWGQSTCKLIFKPTGTGSWELEFDIHCLQSLSISRARVSPRPLHLHSVLVDWNGLSGQLWQKRMTHV